MTKTVHDMSALTAALNGIDISTSPADLKRRSRDFYWYSPVLRRQLDDVVAEAIVTPRDEKEVVATLRECYRRRIPVTARSAGTGNYGQAMPIEGGVVLDVSRLTDIVWIGRGAIRCGAGLRLQHLEKASMQDSSQELRFFPSTRKLATIGGFIAGGSSGVGSIHWGVLSDPGNVLGVRVVTMEEEPRVLELRGAEISKVLHAYGTNGIITEVEMPLATHYMWRDYVIGFHDFTDALRFAQALAEAPGVLKKLVTVTAAPIAQDYFKPLAPLLEADQHIVMLMIAPHSDEAFRQILARFNGIIVYDRESFSDYMPPIYEFTWNHTTLQALKVDAGVTYLQSMFPPPDSLQRVTQMMERFGDEVPMHVEFVRRLGQVIPIGLQLVRFTTEERLLEIIDQHEACGVPVFSPHVYTIEEGGMKEIDHDQLQFKRETDPLGLLNPRKMIGWEDPNYHEPRPLRYL